EVARERVKRAAVVGAHLARFVVVLGSLRVLPHRHEHFTGLEQRVEMRRLLLEDPAEVPERVLLTTLRDRLDSLVVALLDRDHPLLLALPPPAGEQELHLADDPHDHRDEEPEEERRDDDDEERHGPRAGELEGGVEKLVVLVETVSDEPEPDEAEEDAEEGSDLHQALRVSGFSLVRDR